MRSYLSRATDFAWIDNFPEFSSGDKVLLGVFSIEMVPVIFRGLNEEYRALRVAAISLSFPEPTSEDVACPDGGLGVFRELAIWLKLCTTATFKPILLLELLWAACYCFKWNKISAREATGDLDLSCIFLNFVSIDWRIVFSVSMSFAL